MEDHFYVINVTNPLLIIAQGCCVIESIFHSYLLIFQPVQAEYSVEIQGIKRKWYYQPTIGSFRPLKINEEDAF